MKKITTTFLMLIMVITTMFSVVACSKGDRYELTLISGLGVSTEAYDYNYIDFNNDGIYALANLGINSHIYRIMPYLITLIVLAFTSKKSRAPKAEGQPYDKGMR